MPRGFEKIETGSHLSEKLTSLVLTLKDYLIRQREHNKRGPFQPVGAQEIIRYFKSVHMKDIKDSDVRAMVNYLRRDHCPIGSNAKGYFWAKYPQELEETKGQLKDRIIAINKALEGLERAFEDKTGQQMLFGTQL